MPSIVLIKIIFLLFVLSTCSVAAEQFYRWVDQNGRITFTDNPTPPSPEHRLVETQRYTPTSVESREEGLFRLEELRNYNREHPLPSATTERTSEPVFSKAECEAAMRHYELEADSISNTHATVAAAEAQMRTKCNRPERQSRPSKTKKR